MMACDEALILISAEIDGELSEFEKRSLRRHLDVCGQCQTARSEWLALQQATQHSPAPSAPPDVRYHVAAALLRDEVENQLWQTVMTARGRMLIEREGETEWTYTRLSHHAYRSNN